MNLTTHVQYEANALNARLLAAICTYCSQNFLKFFRSIETGFHVLACLALSSLLSSVVFRLSFLLTVFKILK